MTRWAYRIECVPCEGGLWNDDRKKLDEWGFDGWELCATVERDGYWHGRPPAEWRPPVIVYFFKRPLGPELR